MNLSIGLSFEQEFNLKVYQEQIKTLDLQTAQELLLELMRQSMVKENLFKQVIKAS
jgi:hypothetical protein